MEDKLYKTPNGKTFEETYLRERYGDKFGLFVATGQLERVYDLRACRKVWA